MPLLVVSAAAQTARWRCLADPPRVEPAGSAAHAQPAVGTWTQVPGEAVWIQRFERHDTGEARVWVALEGARAAYDARLGVAEWPGAGGVWALSLRSDRGKAGQWQGEGEARLALTSRSSVSLVLGWGLDALHARAALFPFLSGARSRAGLAAARAAQSSGASSST